MTNNWRVNVTIPKDLEEAVMEMRKQDKFCRMSFSQILRYLLEKGVEEYKKETA